MEELFCDATVILLKVAPVSVPWPMLKPNELIEVDVKLRLYQVLLATFIVAFISIKIEKKFR